MDRESVSKEQVRALQMGLAVTGRAAQAMLFHIACIEQETDPEVIEVHIEAMQELDNAVMDVFNRPRRDVKNEIRVGQNDLEKISTKCIQLGLV